MDDLDAFGNSVGVVFQSANSNPGYLFIKSNDNSDTTVNVFIVTTEIDKGGYQEIQVTYEAGAALPSDTEACVFNFARNGGTGSTGATGATGAGSNPIVPRVTTVGSTATPVPDVSTTDLYILSTLAITAVVGAPTGGPSAGQHLEMQILCTGTQKGITWSTSAGGYIANTLWATLPAVTTTNQTIFLSFRYVTANSINKWQLVAKAVG